MSERRLNVITTVGTVVLSSCAVAIYVLPGWLPVTMVIVAGLAVALGVPIAITLWGFARVAAACLTLAALLVEELYASARDTTEGAALAPSYASLGWHVYARLLSNQSIMLLACLLVGAVLLFLPGRRVIPPRYLVAGLLLGAVSALSALLAGGVEGALTSSNAVALLVAGMAIGKHLPVSDGRPVRVALSVFLTYKALIGLAAVAGVGIGSERYVLFYDSATPWVAAAVLLAVIVRQEPIRSSVALWLPALVVVMASPRRAPLLALAVVLLLVGLFNRDARVRMRTVAAAVTGGVMLVLAAQLPGAVGERTVAAIDTLTGGSSDQSTGEHLGDLALGLKYALNGPLLGLGANVPQLPGLAAADARVLYVHDQVLQTWISVGVLGAVAVTYLIVGPAVEAFRRLLAQRTTGLVEAVALACVALVPINLLLFPYLDTTRRWPFLLGIGIAYLGGLRSVEDVEPVRPAPAAARPLGH